jgi:hypothetical protein
MDAQEEMMQPVRCKTTWANGQVDESQVAAKVVVNNDTAGLVSTATDYVRDEVDQTPVLADLLRDRRRSAP